MSDPTTQTILKEVLELKATTASMNTEMHLFTAQHLALSKRVDTLEAAHQRQLGRTSVWALVVSAVVSAITALIGYIIGRH